MKKKRKPVKKAPAGSAALRRLGRLVGTWRLSGEARGVIRFGWAEGGRFLLQDFDIEVFGRRIKGIEVIGHLHRLGAKPSREIWTRVYSFLDGLTLDYVYELEDDTLVVWFRRKGSGNRMKGRFGPDGDTFAGAWQWPGGGYSFTWTRVMD